MADPACFGYVQTATCSHKGQTRFLQSLFTLADADPQPIMLSFQLVEFRKDRKVLDQSLAVTMNPLDR